MDVLTAADDLAEALPPDPHTHLSSYRERLLEHLFISELLRYLWNRKMYQVEVLKSQVDDSGYDLVIEYQTILRHIQLKASYHGAKTNRVPINTKLGTKPSGCVIWIIFDAAEMIPIK